MQIFRRPCEYRGEVVCSTGSKLDTVTSAEALRLLHSHPFIDTHGKTKTGQQTRTYYLKPFVSQSPFFGRNVSDSTETNEIVHLKQISIDLAHDNNRLLPHAPRHSALRDDRFLIGRHRFPSVGSAVSTFVFWEVRAIDGALRLGGSSAADRCGAMRENCWVQNCGEDFSNVIE
ncbi:hypothetical protein BDR06DRAFT_486000 [Suillus hirtellus]|nr:hypothetical protein BDR06DRAFT_486000 [Suillus hirtellus]